MSDNSDVTNPAANAPAEPHTDHPSGRDQADRTAQATRERVHAFTSQRNADCDEPMDEVPTINDDLSSGVGFIRLAEVSAVLEHDISSDDQGCEVDEGACVVVVNGARIAVDVPMVEMLGKVNAARERREARVIERAKERIEAVAPVLLAVVGRVMRDMAGPPGSPFPFPPTVDVPVGSEAHAPFPGNPTPATEAQRCGQYGLCPVCGVPGVERERRPNGNDVCMRGHRYPSADAVKPGGAA